MGSYRDSWAKFVSPIALLPCALGCSSVLSTFTPAPTTPPGSVRGAAALGVNVPVGDLTDLADRGDTIAEKSLAGGTLTRAEQDELVESALALSLDPPSATGELQGRYGVADAFDVGVRVATAVTARIDGRWQFLKSQEQGAFAGSVGLGLAYYARTFEIPNADIEQIVGVAELTRFELDVPLLFGWSGDIGHVWFGPKLVANTYTADVELAFFQNEIVQGSASGTSFFFGGLLGGAVGYKYAWLAFELTILDLSSSASVESNVYNADLSFGGIVLYPALGVIIQI
jgi:hypothetical protein